MTDSTQIFRQGPDVVHRRVAGESILVPIRGNVADMQCLYALDAVGECVWEHLDGTRSVADLAACVTARFDVDPDRALADLQPFLAELLEQGLVEERLRES